jgi:hypothetical protein
MKEESKYLQAHRALCEKAPLLELLDQALNEAQGDDWGGCFTERGRQEYNVTCEILKRRIKELQASAEHR